MNLSAFIAALGLAKAAKRLDVTPATVRRWAAKGVPQRTAGRVDDVLRNWYRGTKAAATRRERQAFKESIQQPVAAYLTPGRPGTGTLDPKDNQPTRTPMNTATGLAAGLVGAVGEGEYPLETDRWVGESNWITVAKPVVDVDHTEIIDLVISLWQASGREWARVTVLAFRYIPFNPLYQGNAVMLAKQGRWLEQWTSTKTLTTFDSLTRAVEGLFLGAVNKKFQRYDGLKDQAESRIIWLESIKIDTFDEKQKEPN